MVPPPSGGGPVRKEKVGAGRGRAPEYY